VAEKEKKEKEVIKMSDNVELVFAVLAFLTAIYFAINGGNIYIWLYNKYNKWRNLKT
jgi:hypothetical protein